MVKRIDRRGALGLLGGVGAGVLLAACSGGDDDTNATADTAPDDTRPQSTTNSAPDPSDATTAFDDASSCTLTPELTEGPYYLDIDQVRRDIREDREGTPLTVALRIRDAAECTAIAGAVVDIWHCDAAGTYSGVDGDDGVFLRGTQVTDADGVVEFFTVYPGWYPGRTVHIHAMVHVDNRSVLTTQLFFDEAVTSEVYSAAPYADRGAPDQRNEADGIFDDALVMTVVADANGYVGRMNFDVDRS